MRSGKDVSLGHKIKFVWHPKTVFPVFIGFNERLYGHIFPANGMKHTRQIQDGTQIPNNPQMSHEELAKPAKRKQPLFIHGLFGEVS